MTPCHWECITRFAGCLAQVLHGFAGMVRGMTLQWGPDLPAQLVARFAQQGMLPHQAAPVLLRAAAEPDRAPASERPATGQPPAMPSPGQEGAAACPPGSRLPTAGARFPFHISLTLCIYLSSYCMPPHVSVLSMDKQCIGCACSPLEVIVTRDSQP